MNGAWYFASGDGTVHGPVSVETLVELIAASRVLPTDRVWREGMPDWVPAASTSLVRGGESTPPPLPPPVAPPPGNAPPPAQAPPTGPAPPTGQASRPDTSSRFAVVGDEPPRFAQFNSRDASRASRERRNGLFIATAGGLVLLLGGVAIGLAIGGGDERQPPAHRDSAAVAPREPRTGAAAEPEATTSATASPSESAAAAGSPRPARDAGAPTTADSPPLADDRPRALAASSPPAPEPSPTPQPPPAPESFRAAEPFRTPEASRTLEASGAPEPSGAVVPGDKSLAAVDREQSFFQDIRIQRRPTFVMQGLRVPQQLDYRIVSRIDLQPRRPDGTRRALLYVEDTRLDQADDLSRAALAKSLEKLKHRQYTFMLNASNEITDFRGDRNQVAALPIKMNLGQGFMVTSVIDDDGWKELAQLTLFQPGPAVTGDQPVKRAMTHDWGPLGHWYGTTEFVGKGLVRLADIRGRPATAGTGAGGPRRGTAGDQPLERIDYTHEMTYVPPGQDGGEGALPMRIQQSDFRTTVAGGSLAYDPRRRRVAYVQERFEVTGTLAIEVLGQASAVELHEQQLLTIQVTDDRPSD